MQDRRNPVAVRLRAAVLRAVVLQAAVRLRAVVQTLTAVHLPAVAQAQTAVRLPAVLTHIAMSLYQRQVPVNAPTKWRANPARARTIP